MSDTKKEKAHITRRMLITGTACLAVAGGGAALIVNQRSGSRRRRAIVKHSSPNDQVQVACIGCGGKGIDDITRGDDAGAKIVAMCDVDPKRAAYMYEHYPQVPKYRDYRMMFDEQADNIDAAFVSTPDHTHTCIALWAMQLGKHVRVQKPLTQTIQEGRQLRQAARTYGVATQMGNQGHAEHFERIVCEWLWDGVIGDIREVYSWTDRPIWPQGAELSAPLPERPVPENLDWDLWLGPAPYRPYNPEYAPFKWRG